MKRPLLLVALLVGTWHTASAQPYASPAPPAGPLTCVVCAKSPLVGKYFVHNQTNNICTDCARLETRCLLCKLPVKDLSNKTQDGRLFCKADLANVVLSEEEGRRLFEQSVTELDSLSDGLLRLRSPKVNVQILFELDFESRAAGKANAMHRIGFSLSRPLGGSFAHNVVLLSGQLRGTTLSTCAHEFGHLWITENVKAGRKLDPDTNEALCELFAYKLAARRNDMSELTRIKQSTYTKGVILSAIEFEAREGLAGVVAWVRNGTEAVLPGTGLASTPAAPEPLRELRPPPPPATKLELRSLLRTAKRTVAVINGERFEPGRELSMLIDGKRRLVRMEAAQENAVVVSVDGARQTLQLGTK